MMIRAPFLFACAVFWLAAVAFAPLARAGVWSVSPWTNDVTSNLGSGQTAWAYRFGTNTTATVDGVSVPGLAHGASRTQSHT
ncbi:MAG: hypothetical protein ACK5TH_21650 [Prosthecobacter sp.]